KEPRVSYLLLNNQLEVLGNFHTDYKDMEASGLAEEIASVGIKFGAKAIIPYGNVDIKGIKSLSEEVKNYSMGDLRIVDALQVKEEGHQSAYDAGLMETGLNYGEDLIGRTMTKEEASEALNFIKDHPTVLPDEIELTQDNWEKEFGKDQKVQTPLMEVKLSENQFKKMGRSDRKKRIALIKPTLENPDIILEENDPKEGALRDSKLLFIKTFIKPDGTRHLHFESVSVKQPGAEVVISNHEIQEGALKEKMQNNKVLHLRGDMPFGSEMRLTTTPMERPDLLPSSDKSTESKINEYPGINQGVSEVRDSGAKYGKVDLGEAIRSIREDIRILNADDNNAKRAAMKAIGGNLNILRRAMARQREYDVSTVKNLTDLAKFLMDSNLLDDLSNAETKRILGAIPGSISTAGSSGSKKAVERIVDIMVDNQLLSGVKRFSDLVTIKGSRVDARGVEVQGILDPDGQRMAQVVKKSISLPKDDIENRIAEALDRMGSTDQTIADEAAIEYSGLQVALRYADDIKGSKNEEKYMRQSLKQAKDKISGRIATEETKRLLREYDGFNRRERELSELKKRDVEAYKEGRRELRQNTDLRTIGRVKRYKRDIKELTEEYLKTRDLDRLQELVEQMERTRERMLEDTGTYDKR
ncbi:MAG: hypothetical protein J1E78_05860, partial [Muribaculaceae bacterium]|nr:hypothetical protein [Muribaculaceae bacterium]